MHKWFKIIVYTLLSIAAIGSALQGFRNAIVGSQDFQWSPAVIFWEGENPYEVALEGDPEEKIVLSQYPNYLHLFYILLFPMASLSFDDAKIIWALLNIFIAVAVVFLIGSKAKVNGSGWILWIVSCIFLMSTPLRNGIGNGQASLFVFFFLSLYWFGAGKLRGLWLAFGVVKYSFAPVFVLRSFFSRESALVVTVAVLVVGLIFFSVYSSSFYLMLPFEPLLVAAKTVAPGQSDLMTILRYDLGFPLWLSALICLGFVSLVAFITRNENATLLGFATVCLASLLFIQHRGYDYVALLPLLFMIFVYQPVKVRLWLFRFFAGLLVFYFYFWLRIQFQFYDDIDSVANRVFGFSLLLAVLILLCREIIFYKSSEGLD